MKNKNEFSTHTLATLATLATNTLKKANNAQKGKNTPPAGEELTHQRQAATAKHVSSILAGLYRQRTGSEWEWLQINRPDWWTERAELENKLDGHFLAGELEAGTKGFHKLLEHLRSAPIDNLSSRIARQIDNLPASRPKQKPARLKPPFKKLPGHPEPWQGGRISGREYFGMPPMKN